MIITLDAGVSQNVTIAGARFYFVDGLRKINVKLKGSGDSRDFDLYPRQGVNSDTRFTGIEITNISDETQTIEFEISDREVFDNRIPEITEIVPVGGFLPVMPIAPVEARVPHMVANTSYGFTDYTEPTILFQFNDKRTRGAFIVVREDREPEPGQVVRIGRNAGVNEINGYPVQLGADYIHENHGELWILLPPVGTYRVHVIEDLTGSGGPM